ncbi:PD-(D/E)XK nuclease family protein [Patescibacteria group bacterium]|nr:PD-(D/E)XK nuclease family protein [Patescibacteria group bacterium]MBU1755155.1 PD-(D/E)XK nuclease family protein [Patescibacteria group bacterium]
MAFPYKLKWEKGRFNPTSKEPYTLSRSKVERFLECPRCFWMEARYGVGRPDSFPFNLNNAVDELFKKEFDIHRADGKPHPLMEQYKIDAVPFNDPRMEEWRDAMKRGIKVHHEPSNLIFRGGIDDVWVKPDGELYVVDYKATAGKESITLDEEWKDGYKRQVEMYQWLFRNNGFKVSPTAYFVYANGRADKEAFDGKLEFDVTILPYEGDDSWVEGTLDDVKACLVSEDIPAIGVDCTYCPYREHAGKLLLKIHKATKK